MTIKKAIKARRIDQVLDILWTDRDRCKIIAGGTDIMIDIRNKKIQPEILIDVSSLEAIQKIEELDGYIEIGAGVTFTDIVKHSLFDGNLYGLKKASRMVGSPQIRNKGTIGGNIMNGSSAADSIPPLLCLNTILVYESKEGVREVDLEGFYTDREANGPSKNEILTKVRFKKPGDRARLTFAKLGLRQALAISRISNSVMIELDNENRILDARVASGALGRYPLRERSVEDYLVGKVLNDKTKDGAFELIQEAMRERLEGRSTFPYKKVAVESTFREAMDGVILNEN